MDEQFETKMNDKTCACLDDDARRCYEKRYIGFTKENETEMREAICGCPCHDHTEDCNCDDCLPNQFDSKIVNK